MSDRCQGDKQFLTNARAEFDFTIIENEWNIVVHFKLVPKWIEECRPIDFHMIASNLTIECNETEMRYVLTPHRSNDRPPLRMQHSNGSLKLESRLNQFNIHYTTATDARHALFLSKQKECIMNSRKENRKICYNNNNNNNLCVSAFWRTKMFTVSKCLDRLLL